MILNQELEYGIIIPRDILQSLRILKALVMFIAERQLQK